MEQTLEPEKVIRKLSQYTYRHPVKIDLLKSKKAHLESYFNNGIKEGDRTYGVKDLIFEFDEFDKTVKKLMALKKYQEQKRCKQTNQHKQPKLCKKTDKDDDDKDDDRDENTDLEIESLEIDWDLDDLLSILCGSYVPDSRMTVANGNEFEYMKEICPQLFRAGRMTPIKFEYGNRELFREIVKDYADIEIDLSKLKENFRFRQSAITEFLLSRDDITEDMIFMNMSSFEIIN